MTFRSINMESDVITAEGEDEVGKFVFSGSFNGAGVDS